MQHKLQYNGNKGRISITNNGTTATNVKYGVWATVIDPSTIKCSSDKAYIWKVKCVKYKYAGCWSIGIHAADKAYDDRYFMCKDLSYSYTANGDAYDCKKKIKGASSGWQNGDILSVSYSPKMKQLSLAINNKKQSHSMKIKDNPNGYKMAICMSRTVDCAELMDFIVIEDNDNNSEEKKSTANVKEIEVNISFLFCPLTFMNT